MKTYIIAEVGPNHNGSLELAIEYINKLSNIGVDAVKFQLGNPEKTYSQDAFKAEYQKKAENSKSPTEMAKKHQLKPDEHKVLYEKCKESGVDYLCSAFDLDSFLFLDRNFDLPYYKIPSGEIFSIDILDYIAGRNKPIILSTGMATYDEIEVAINLLNRSFKKDITILHCISNYPVACEDVNMNVMLELERRFGYPVGFSDHTVGNESAITAIALGASVIEKHVTLDRRLSGPDHQASSTIEEFVELVKSIRRVEKIMGNTVKRFSAQEKEITSVARKSIVSKRNILPGEIIKKEDICYKRPGTGFLPTEKDEVIGKKALKTIPVNKVILREYLDND
tara:strand:+ start:706 stop:1719 length:1014 start_codon:yes stop_codon:yes gene_type:complete